MYLKRRTYLAPDPQGAGADPNKVVAPMSTDGHQYQVTYDKTTKQVIIHPPATLQGEALETFMTKVRGQSSLIASALNTQMEANKAKNTTSELLVSIKAEQDALDTRKAALDAREAALNSNPGAGKPDTLLWKFAGFKSAEEMELWKVDHIDEWYQKQAEHTQALISGSNSEMSQQQERQNQEAAIKQKASALGVDPTAYLAWCQISGSAANDLTLASFKAMSTRTGDPTAEAMIAAENLSIAFMPAGSSIPLTGENPTQSMSWKEMDALPEDQLDGMISNFRKGNIPG